PAHDYLHRLYRETDLICLGRTTTDFQTLPFGLVAAKVPDLSAHEFINPSPMSALSGLTQEGNYSPHTKSNTGPRVYGVVEVDDGTALEHVALLNYLASKLPLVMMVFSGNASIHGWFKTSHIAEEQVKEFYDIAISLGADPRMFSVCQFARLPIGKHAT